jgi:hypothetical protein
MSRAKVMHFYFLMRRVAASTFQKSGGSGWLKFT